MEKPPLSAHSVTQLPMPGGEASTSEESKTWEKNYRGK